MFVTVHAWEITDTGLRGRHDGYGCRRGRHGLRWPDAGRLLVLVLPGSRSPMEEPLVRKDCVQIISEIKSLNDVEQVTLTTNGILLEEQAEALKKAGIDCINVSLDTLDPRLYRQITGQAAPEKVLAGIRQAEKLDSTVHVNTVLPCLCYGESIDGREILQAENHEQIRELLQSVILAKSQMQCFDIKGKITENKQMVQIGG